MDSTPQSFERERDALAAADAERDDAAFQTVAAHRMNEPRGEHGPGGADGVTVRDGAAFDVDDVLGEAELTRHHDGDGGECLVDLHALYRAEIPARALQRLPHG